MTALTKTFPIINALGLHARAATKLVQTASRFPCEVAIELDGQKANAKSVMGVLLLAAGRGTAVTVTARGEGAEACLTALETLIADRFGEGQ